MNPFLPMALAWMAGLGLGLFYFGGLWLTVQRLPSLKSPMPLVLASFVLRTAVVVVGFYFVMDGRWERMLACLAGFIMVRLILVSRMRAELDSYLPPQKNGG